MGAGTTIALIKALAKVDPATIEQAVSDYLDDHPEIVVEDGSITKTKLSVELQAVVDNLKDVVNLYDALYEDIGYLNEESGGIRNFNTTILAK